MRDISKRPEYSSTESLAQALLDQWRQNGAQYLLVSERGVCVPIQDYQGSQNTVGKSRYYMITDADAETALINSINQGIDYKHLLK